MKISVSLLDRDVEFLDGLAAEGGQSRSAVVAQAIEALRTRDLTADYEAALAEWDASEDGRLWAAIETEGTE